MSDRSKKYQFIEPADLNRYISELGYRLAELNSPCSIQVFGGGALVLGYGLSRKTEDIDMHFIQGNRSVFDRVSSDITSKYSLGTHWINSSGAFFLSSEPDLDQWYRDYYSLRVYFVSLPHMLALKIRAFREKDMGDLALIIRALGLSSSEAVVSIHDRFFDDSGIEYLPENEILYRADAVFNRMRLNLI